MNKTESIDVCTGITQYTHHHGLWEILLTVFVWLGVLGVILVVIIAAITTVFDI